MKICCHSQNQKESERKRDRERKSERASERMRENGGKAGVCAQRAGIPAAHVVAFSWICGCVCHTV